MSRWTFETTDELSRPRGPERALDEAVAILAPFNFRPVKYPGLELDVEFDPETLARARVMNLAEAFNAAQHRASRSPRVNEIIAGLSELEALLRSISSKMNSLDDWSRLHLLSELQRRHLDPELLPQVFSDDRGSFGWKADEMADVVAATALRLQAIYGGGKIADQGGRQAHDERFLGGAKSRFVKDAFDIFESYHPGSATSSEGSDFHTFIHLVYEFATGEHDEDEAALSHLLRSLITPLKEHRAAEAAFWSVEHELRKAEPDTLRYRALREQQAAHHRRRSELASAFAPLLNRLRGQPDPKTPK
jgi:hypothetical protein